MSVKVFFFVIFALAVSFVVASPTKKSNYIEQENSCREVCGLCDCDGFYCEDECICECSLEDDQNLQCIADMKTECDANGLEYELMMEESTKERFLREIQHNGLNFDKHLFVMKQKRQSNSTSDPTVGAAAPNASPDPVVAAPAPASAAAASTSDGDSTVGNTLITSLASKTAISGFKGLASKSSIATLPGLSPLSANSVLPAFSSISAKNAIASVDAPRILVILRERLAASKAKIAASTAALPAISTSSVVKPAAIVAPAAATQGSWREKLNDLKIVVPAAATQGSWREKLNDLKIVAPAAPTSKLASLKPSWSSLPVLPAHLS